jgi:uncharacterized protein YprB with RNaseH-like and TPR domain
MSTNNPLLEKFTQVRIEFSSGKSKTGSYPSLSTLEKELAGFARTNGIRRGGRIVTGQLKCEAPQIYNWLRYYGTKLIAGTGDSAVSKAIETFGYQVERRPPVTPDAAVSDAIRKAIPLDRMRGICAGYETVRGMSGLLKEAGEQKVLRALTNTGRKLTLEGALNNAYPELEVEFPHSPAYYVTGQAKPAEIRSLLEKWVYAGNSFAPEAMAAVVPHGRRIMRAIRRQLRTGQMQFDFEDDNKNKPDESDSATVKFMGFAASYLERKGFSFSDVIYDKGSKEHAARTNELQFGIIALTAKQFDPTGGHFSDLYTHIPRPIEAVYVCWPHQHVVQVQNGPRNMYADVRIHSGGKQTLVELKTGRARKVVINGIIERFGNKKRWFDGGRIDNKLAVIDSADDTHVERDEALLSNAGIEMMTGSEYSNLWREAIEILASDVDADGNNWFTRSGIITPSPQQMVDTQRWLQESPHLAYIRGQAYHNEWFRRVYQRFVHILRTGQEFNPAPMHPPIRQVRFSDFADFYGEERTKRYRTGSLYIDIETTGFVGEGNIVTHIGAGHVQNRHMVVDTFFTAHPADERETLLKFKRFAHRFDQVVTFNGRTFDLPFLSERFRTHRIRPPQILEYARGNKERDPDAHEVDVLHDYFARNAMIEQNPDAKLQSYERTITGQRRKGDVPGSAVPEVYGNYLQGKADPRLVRIVDHLHKDVFTLMCAHNDMRDKYQRAR